MKTHQYWPVLATALFACSPFSAQGAAQHPLDALEASEIIATTAILRRAGHLDDKTLIASLTLQEPPKAAVLAWKTGDPIPRRAKVVLRRNSATFEAVVDLASGTRIGNSNHLSRPNRVRVTGLTVSVSLASTGLARQTRPPASRRYPGPHPDSALPRP